MKGIAEYLIFGRTGCIGCDNLKEQFEKDGKDFEYISADRKERSNIVFLVELKPDIKSDVHFPIVFQKINGEYKEIKT